MKCRCGSFGISEDPGEVLGRPAWGAGIGFSGGLMASLSAGGDEESALLLGNWFFQPHHYLPTKQRIWILLLSSSLWVIYSLSFEPTHQCDGLSEDF